MIRTIRAATALAFLITGAIASAQVAEYVPGEILVKFRSNTSRAGLLENLAVRAKRLLTIPRLDVQQIKLPAGMSVMDGVAYYSNMSTVVYAEPNYKKSLDFVPNDPRYSSQWGQKKIQCPQAWDLTQGSGAVTIAVIDSGCDVNHEDLKNKLVPGYDFSDDDPDVTPDGDHGVHTAGIAAADTNNNRGVAGTGFNCKIMPLKIFPNATDAVSAAAIIHAADNGAKVITMSYGSYGESQTEKNAVNYAWGKGVVLFASAGNLNTDAAHFPSDFENVISVGSTNTNDQKSDFSNFGADRVDIAAPGENIMSTVTGGYANETGTSMACPMAAGVAGLLWGIAPAGTTNVEIREAIESTTDPIPNNNNFVKYGRINAYKAAKKFESSIVAIESKPSAVTHWYGTNPDGDESDLLASDTDFYTVSSTIDSLGQVGGVIVDLDYAGNVTTGLRTADFIVEANAPSGTSHQVFFWNYTTNRFQLMRSIALRPSGTNRQKASLPKNLTPFISGGKLRVGLKAIAPKRSLRGTSASPFDLNINYVVLETRESN